MPFDWAEYLRLAQSLNGDDAAVCEIEGRQRSSVSRAYYAAFCLARNFARDHYHFTPTYSPQDHETIRREYANAATALGGEDRRRISNVAIQLNNLRQWRNYCDYDDELSGLTSMTKMSLREAAALIETLSLANNG
jgi:hypothetical protein